MRGGPAFPVLAHVPTPARVERRDPEDWLPALALMFGNGGQQSLPQYLSLAEASKYMGLSMNFLRRLIKAGKLHAVRDGRLKVRRVDLDNLPAPAELAEMGGRAEAAAE